MKHRLWVNEILLGAEFHSPTGLCNNLFTIFGSGAIPIPVQVSDDCFAAILNETMLALLFRVHSAT